MMKTKTIFIGLIFLSLTVMALYPGEETRIEICDEGATDFTCDYPLIYSTESVGGCILLTISVPPDAPPSTYYCYYLVEGEEHKYRPRRSRRMGVEFEETYIINEPVSIHVTYNSRPLEDVDVDVFHSNGKKVFYGLTNEDGLFTFTPSIIGNYLIELDKSGFRGEEIHIDIYHTVATTSSTTSTTTTSTQVVGVECISHYEKKCMGNFLWWFDSCGSYEEIAERCAFGCYREFDFCRSYEEITTTTIQDVTTTTIDTNTPITLTTIDEDEPDKQDLSDFLGALAIFLGLMAGFVMVYLYIKRRNNSSEQ